MHSCSDLCFFPNEPSARVSPFARPFRLAHSSLVMDAIGPSAARSCESILATIPALLFHRHPGFGSYGTARNGGILLVCGRHLACFRGGTVDLYSPSGLGGSVRFGGSSRILSWLACSELHLLSQDVGQHRQTSHNSPPARRSTGGCDGDIGE